MNVKKTKKFFEEVGIIALKADRDKNLEVDQLLSELGNMSHGLPYYAIFSGATNRSVHFGGNYITSQTVLNAIEQVQGENVDRSEVETEVAEALPSKLK